MGRRLLGRIGAAVLAVAGTTAAASAESAPLEFHWPENPFSYALPETTFQLTGEARFVKTARVFGETLGGAGQELFDIATYPLRDPLTFGTFAAGVGALVLLDRPLTAAYQQTIVPIGERFDLPRPIKALPPVFTDGTYVLGASAGAMLYGVAANDERAQVAALLSAKAVAYSYLTSHVILKPIFGRVRPVSDLASHTGPGGNFTTSPFEWFRSTGIHLSSQPYATGMPSFHMTMYFASARVWSGVYDNSVLPYVAAGAIALASAEGHHHWVSDMAAGALIGTGIGNVILKDYYDRHTPRYGTVVPVVSSKGVGLNWTVSF